MTYEVYRYIFIGGAILAVIMFIISVILFITLKIPEVIANLSGWTARRTIQKILEENENLGNEVPKIDSANLRYRRLTDRISPSGKILPRYARNKSKLTTEKLGENLNNSRFEKRGTEVLKMSVERKKTDILITPSRNETTTLSQMVPSASIFEIEYDITYIFSDEIIS